MEQTSSSDNQAHVYRVDKFVVPASARVEFLERVTATHDLLRKLPGFLRQFLLEQTAGPGEFNVVTLVEWESQGTMEKARNAVIEMHKQAGFNPQEMFARLGIRADLANYRLIGT
jgi:heme-degrading monooxygenase HmoA